MPILRIPPEWQIAKQSLPSVNNVALPYGVYGNESTIRVMRGEAHKYKGHPAIRGLALKILSYYSIPSQNHLEEAAAIGAYVQEKIEYAKDPVGIEQLHSPLYMLEQIQRGESRGDCDDMSLMIATLLLSIGIQPYYRAIRYRTTAGPYNHIYVVVKESNWRQQKQTLVLDAIIKDRPMGFEVPKASYQDYMV